MTPGPRAARCTEQCCPLWKGPAASICPKSPSCWSLPQHGGSAPGAICPSTCSGLFLKIERHFCEPRLPSGVGKCSLPGTLLRPLAPSSGHLTWSPMEVGGCCLGSEAGLLFQAQVLPAAHLPAPLPPLYLTKAPQWPFGNPEVLKDWLAAPLTAKPNLTQTLRVVDSRLSCHVGPFTIPVHPV